MRLRTSGRPLRLAIVPVATLLGLAAWGLRGDPDRRIAREDTQPAARDEVALPASPSETRLPVPASDPAGDRGAVDSATPVAGLESASATTGPAGSAGMVVRIDPETGELGGPAPDREALAMVEDPAVSRSQEGLIEIHRGDGAVGIDLQGRFQEHVVVRIGPDGRPLFGCVHSEARLGRDLPVPAPAPLEEK